MQFGHDQGVSGRSTFASRLIKQTGGQRGVLRCEVLALSHDLGSPFPSRIGRVGRTSTPPRRRCSFPGFLLPHPAAQFAVFRRPRASARIRKLVSK